MAYKIVAKAKAWRSIRWDGLTDDGEVVTNVIRGRFILIDEDEFVDFNDDVAAVSSKLAAATDKSERQKLSEVLSPFVLRVLEDWQDVTEDDGTDAGRSVPFTKANLERMLRVPNFAGGVMEALRAARAAEPEVREGN